MLNIPLAIESLRQVRSCFAIKCSETKAAEAMAIEEAEMAAERRSTAVGLEEVQLTARNAFCNSLDPVLQWKSVVYRTNTRRIPTAVYMYQHQAQCDSSVEELAC